MAVSAAGAGGWSGGHSYSGYSGNATSAATVNRGNFAGTRGFNRGNFNNFNGRYANFNGRYANDFNRGFYGGGHNRGYWGGGYWGCGYYGGFWPGLGLGLGLWPLWNWGWGNPYAYSLYGYYPDNGYYYSYNGYPSDQSGYVQSTTVNSVPQTAGMTSEDQQGQAIDDAAQYYSEARTAFQQRDYNKALRLAAHAEIDAPANAKVHELLSLSLFAIGNYPAAASEAHAAMALGPIADWAELYSCYEDENVYTRQLRVLEKAASDHPKEAADHFLLGYQYLMIGARPAPKMSLRRRRS